MTSGSLVLNVLTSKLLGKSQIAIELQKSFNAFAEVYISSNDKQCRITELKKYFDLYGELIFLICS